MATPKKPTPKVKITGSASSSGGRAANTPSITNRGSIAQSPKVGYGKDGFKPSAKPKPSPTKKGLKIALGGGVTMDSKTGIKTTATPKPKPIPTLSNKEYLRRQKEFLAQQKKAKKK
jgi:hypothetical protein